MRVLVRAPGVTFENVLTAIRACDATILFFNRKKAMLTVDATDACLSAIAQAGGEIWRDDRDTLERAH